MKNNMHKPINDWFKWFKSFSTIRALITLWDLDFAIYIADRNSCNNVLNDLFVIKARTQP